MSLWSIFGKTAVSDTGETIQKVSNSTYISSNGTVYNTVGNTTTGSDGSVYTQMGPFSTDGSVRRGHTANGIGSVFDSHKHLSEKIARYE